MTRERSIFKKLIIYNLPISIIPFLLLLMLFFGYTCYNLKSEERRHLQDRMNDYMQNVVIAKNDAISKTEYIVKNIEITTYLEEVPEDLMNHLLVLKKIENYISIINNSPQVSITIYTDNSNILKSRFVDRMENLNDHTGILTKLQKSDYMYFDENLYTENDTNKKYLMLYRGVLSEREIIICVKAYLPESESIHIVMKNNKYANEGLYLSEEVTPGLIAVAELNTSKLTSQYVRYSIFFLIIGLTFCVVIFYATATMFGKTTNSISTFILRLSKKDLLKANALEEADDTDSMELRIIKKSLNQLITNLNESKEAQYKVELSKKRLELDLLQSKIDPHLLYNTLATISHRAFKNKDKEMFEVIKNLSRYYRLVLAQGKEFVTLSDELDMIRKYISINEFSHSQQYHYTEKVEPKLMENKFLHLALQPFIENAIVHGLAGKKPPREIRLECFCEDRHMVLKIYDNGYGMTEDKLNEIRNLSGLEQSYGIKNTYDRLCLYYENDCRIDFCSEFGKFTEVTLRIPRKPPHE